ncbi:MAG: iron export ABC transporter permease subunit FetB [Acidimicrobiales bacterium]|nr:iron export ABC transporter permease subunit FetB [Acidimicrobiales bacterium]
MNDLADIGLDGLALSGILIAVALVLSFVRRLGLERDLLIAAVRALVQLLIVGFALRIVVDGDDPLIFTWIWVAVMVVVASWTVRRRAPEVPNVIPLALASFAAAAAVTLGVLFGLRVFEPTGRAIVPMAGVMVGNSMTATVVVSRRLVAEARDHRGLIEARLALGLSSQDAFAPHLREALRTGLVPQIETTKTVGLIALPGAMTGLILAGVEPVEAVRVQVAVMYLVLGSVSTTASVMALGLTRRMFTKDHRLAVAAVAQSRP